MIHTFTESELEYGFIEDDVFENYPANHEFDAAEFRTLEGVYTLDAHKNGKIHKHSTDPRRVDGFTKLMRELIAEGVPGGQVRIRVQDNVIIVSE